MRGARGFVYPEKPLLRAGFACYAYSGMTQNAHGGRVYEWFDGCSIGFGWWVGS
jgi:hypothetical protein